MYDIHENRNFSLALNIGKDIFIKFETKAQMIT